MLKHLVTGLGQVSYSRWFGYANWLFKIWKSDIGLHTRTAVNHFIKGWMP